MLNLSIFGCLEVVVLWLETQQTATTSFNEIKGFLSLQLELRLELGLWLRLTNNMNNLLYNSVVQELEMEAQRFKLCKF